MRQNGKIHWWYTEIGEAEKSQVLSAFDRKCFSLGGFTQKFEDWFARIVGARYAVAQPVAPIRTWFFASDVTTVWPGQKLREGEAVRAFEFKQLASLDMPSVMYQTLER